jgi:hypothetical protein
MCGKRCGCGSVCKGEPGIQGVPGIAGSNGFVSSQKGITAYASGGQGMATKLVAVKNRVDTVSVTNASVVCYKAVAGVPQEIYNNGANDLEVFPYYGDKFLGKSVNESFILSPGASIYLFCYEDEDGTWTY